MSEATLLTFFSLDKNAVRIELWGDEIVDIRYFNNENQKSIEKLSLQKLCRCINLH
ncbi:MAG: hypothetical protein ACLSA2_00205 [Candidatus Gastranaerophilaceae bacterium]